MKNQKNNVRIDGQLCSQKYEMCGFKMTKNTIMKFCLLAIACFGLLATNIACVTNKSEEEKKISHLTSENTNGLKIDVQIDGERYAQKQLDRYEHERTIQMLHQFKYLGVDIVDNGKSLSFFDINWLEPVDAKRISIDTRMKLGDEGFLNLFDDILMDSEKRWRSFSAVPIAEQGFQLAEVILNVSGLKFEQLVPADKVDTNLEESNFAMLSEDKCARLSVFPEHYIMGGSTVENFHGSVETVGMFGGPIALIPGEITPGIPDHIPIRFDPEYPIAFTAEVNFNSDGSPVNLGVVHAFRPTENGFVQKSTLFLPNNAPKALADGHKLHFAIELINDYIATYEKLGKSL